MRSINILTHLLAFLPFILADLGPTAVPPGCHGVCDPVADMTVNCHSQHKLNGTDYTSCMCAANAGSAQIPLCAACINFKDRPGHGINVLVRACFLSRTVWTATATDDGGVATVETVTVTVNLTDSLGDATTAGAYATATGAAGSNVSAAASVTTATASATALFTTASGLTTVASSASSAGGVNSSSTSESAAVQTASGSGASNVQAFGFVGMLVLGGMAIAL